MSSSSSQANEVKELRRDSVRTSSKGLLEEVIFDSGFLILDWRRDCSRKAPTGVRGADAGRQGRKPYYVPQTRYFEGRPGRAILDV